MATGQSNALSAVCIEIDFPGVSSIFRARIRIFHSYFRWFLFRFSFDARYPVRSVNNIQQPNTHRSTDRPNDRAMEAASDTANMRMREKYHKYIYF